MAHPYPHHCSSFDYRGRSRYALNFSTLERRRIFVDAASVSLVWTQIVRACTEEGFEVIVYCFMPDHLHLIAGGEDEAADCKAFIKAAKQYSGYYFSQARHFKLWERYGHDHVIRDEQDLAMTLRYLLSNPVQAGLVKHPRDYPFLGSTVYTVDELLQWCEYSEATFR